MLSEEAREKLMVNYVDCLKTVNRNGIKKLIAWLLKSDFFIAPYSTSGPGAYRGGLLEHSMRVFERLTLNYSEVSKYIKTKESTEKILESLTLCALLSDICLANSFKEETWQVKDEKGEWIEKSGFVTDDRDMLPYGYGEKSVYIANGFIRLTREEAIAIRFHGGPDSEFAKKAYEQYLYAWLLYVSDLEARYMIFPCGIDDDNTSEAST